MREGPWAGDRDRGQGKGTSSGSRRKRGQGQGQGSWAGGGRGRGRGRPRKACLQAAGMGMGTRKSRKRGIRSRMWLWLNGVWEWCVRCVVSSSGSGRVGAGQGPGGRACRPPVHCIKHHCLLLLCALVGKWRSLYTGAAHPRRRPCPPAATCQHAHTRAQQEMSNCLLLLLRLLLVVTWVLCRPQAVWCDAGYLRIRCPRTSDRSTPLAHEELEKVGGNVQVWVPRSPSPRLRSMYFEIKSHASAWRNRLTAGTCLAPLPRLRALVLAARSCYYWTVHRVLRAEMPRGLLAC